MRGYDYGDNNPTISLKWFSLQAIHDPCTGYWDEQMNWHGFFQSYGWMVDLMIKMKIKYLFCYSFVTSWRNGTR
jgi:hypothetical protein